MQIMPFIQQVVPYVTPEDKAAVAEYLDSGGWLTEFAKTRELEEMIADFTGARHCTVVTSGTVALYLCLLSAGIGPGDKVVVPNYTMIATPNAVKWTGAEPVLADVDPETLCLDMDKIPVDAYTRAVMYVSINGRSGDMQRLVDFCNRNEWILIEDACQALGSQWNGKYLGTFGRLGTFSFTPHKIITTGQGGCIITDDEGLHGQVRKLKDFHRIAPGVDVHDGIGFNFKFTDLQAALGVSQMKGIASRVARKKEIFELYVSGLREVEEIEFLPTDLNMTAPWFVDALLPSKEIRDNLAIYLKEKGIGSRPFYPPVNHQQMYSERHPMGSLPVSEGVACRGLWLPSSMALKKGEITYVSETIKQFFEQRK
jgi:perosamine synthetase